ncbi:Hsp20/alpha crystallin family protein [Virgibacillus sp. DJP39]|uniref:Hsp20/alpha crystallin family protein n=1 Tax=Virgibacillus sp. DJP39 TaxID=3409790 RepID=UPI003BB6F922
MDPFQGNNPFGNLGKMNAQQFPTDYLEQVKDAMEQYNSVFNQEFWNNINGIGANKRHNKRQHFPIEIWESDKELFVLAYIPGIKETRQVKAAFLSEEKMKIKAKLESEQPLTAIRKLDTELSKVLVERDIILPYPVKSDNYTVHVDQGVTTLIFEKINPFENTPFD